MFTRVLAGIFIGAGIGLAAALALAAVGVLSNADATDQALTSLAAAVAGLWLGGLGAVLGGIVAALQHRRKIHR